jgi:hypothetical protein
MEYEVPGNGGSTGFSFQPPAGFAAAQQPTFPQFPAAAPRAYSGTYAPTTDVSINTPPNIIVIIDVHSGSGVHNPITLPPNVRVGFPYEPRDRCTMLLPYWKSIPTTIDWQSFFQPENMFSVNKSYQFFSQIDNKILKIKDIPFQVYYYVKQANNQYQLQLNQKLNEIILDSNGINQSQVTDFTTSKVTFQLKDLITNIVNAVNGSPTAIIMHTCDSSREKSTRRVHIGTGFSAYNRTPTNRNLGNMNNRSRKSHRGLRRKKTRKN